MQTVPARADAESREASFVQAEEMLLADPATTRRIVLKILPGIDATREPQAIVRAHFLVARAASLLGDADQILQWAEPVRAAAEKSAEPVLLVKLYAVLGEGYEFSGNAPKALEHYKLALVTAEKSKNSWLVAYALNFIGWMHNRKMEEKQAMEHIQRAYMIMKKLPPDDLYHDLLNNLGNLYGNKLLAREVESVKLLNEAKDYFIGKNKHFYASAILYNLGLALKSKQPKAALVAFEESLLNAEKIQDESSIAYCRYGLGLSYSLLENFVETEKQFLQAAAGFINTNNTMMNTEVQKHLLITFTVSAQWEKALRILPKAEELLRKHGGILDVIVFLEQKITIMNALGRKDDELATYREYGRLSHDYQIQQDRETINKFSAEFDLERKEHEKEILSNQNKLQSLELEKADRTRNILIGAALLSVCIIVLGIRSKLKDREMRVQRRRMQQILDSIQEGILRFGADLRIERDFSKHLLQLIDRQDDLSGQSILDVLLDPSQLPLDEKSQIRESLGVMLGEARLSWELNSSHLPAEISLHSRTLALGWEPLFDDAERLQKIQLILRDVTESRQLAQKIAEEKARIDIWQSKLQQLLSQDFKRAVQFLRETVQKKDWSLSELHTVKGNARTLGLKSLAEATHKFETDLGGFEDFERELQEWLPLIKTMGFASVGEPEHVFDVLKDIIPDLQNMLSTVDLSLEELLVKDGFQNWTGSSLEMLRIILLHGLTNALDHGYIIPMQRGETMPHARLGIEIAPTVDGLQLVIRDYGRGLDWDKIRQIATKKNFMPDEGRPWSDVLFLSGTSTSQAVTATSGRGVGLSVIAETCQQLQGDVALLDNELGTGTQLVVRWPLLRSEAA